MSVVETERRPLIGDTWVNPFTMSSLIETFDRAASSPDKSLIVNHNVNSMVLHRRDADMRALYSIADGCFVDGTPIIWIGRLLGEDLSAAHRLGVLDWIWPVLAMAERRRFRVAHLGGTEEVDAQSNALIRRRHPNLHYASRHGHFDHSVGSAENEAVLQWINQEAPDLLLVGMGMPLQERWLLENYHRLPDCTVITVGGIMGYLAGERPTAPRWLGPLGLEWLYRLASEPRRLARRYLVEPWALVPPLTAEVVGRRLRRRRRDRTASAAPGN